jgi:hypothetical protein
MEIMEKRPMDSGLPNIHAESANRLRIHGDSPQQQDTYQELLVAQTKLYVRMLALEGHSAYG